jgi:hypothetical protein
LKSIFVWALVRKCSSTRALLNSPLSLFSVRFLINPFAWYVSEYVFGVRTSKLSRHLGVKSSSTYSKEYVKHTRHCSKSCPTDRATTAMSDGFFRPPLLQKKQKQKRSREAEILPSYRRCTKYHAVQQVTLRDGSQFLSSSLQFLCIGTAAIRRQSLCLPPPLLLLLCLLWRGGRKKP